MLAVLVVAGTAPGLAASRRGCPGARPRLVFFAVGLLAAFVFAAGRFGADVGAAIVFPVGAAVAAAAIAGHGRRRWALLASPRHSPSSRCSPWSTCSAAPTPI